MNERLRLQLERHIGDISTLPDNIAGLLAEVSDMYDQSDAKEAELVAVKHHVQLCDEIAGIGRWEYDLSNNTHGLVYPWHTSEQVIKILGLDSSVETLTGDLFFSTVHPGDIDAVKNALTTAIANHSDYNIEFRTIHPDGKERIIRARGKVVSDEQTGKPVKFAGVLEDVTAVRDYERQLSNVGNEIKQVFDNINEVFWAIDMEQYQCTQMSGAAERVYGYPAADFLSDPDLWFNIIVAEDKPIIYGNHPRLSQGESIAQEYRIHHKDGDIHWVENRLEPVLNAEGKLVRLYGVTSDITRRKEAELALAESEIKFRSLTEYSADLVVILSEDGIVKYANGTLHKTMGYELDEFIGTDSIPYMHPEDQVKIIEFRKIVMVSPGVPLSNTYRRITKDGREVWCEGTATNLLHVPEVNGIVINIKDITGRVEAEEALKASEYKLSSLLRNASDAITVVDENYRVVFAADSLSAITGFDPEEVHGKTFAEFVHPEDLETVKAYFEQVKSCYGDPMRIVYRSRKKDGSYFWAERITVNLLHDPIVRGIVSNYRDVTERRKYIEALEITNDNLQKTNMELDKFVYSVSHDLRAPLSSMLGVIDLMESEPLPASAIDDLQLLKDSIKKLDGFILDILDYSKNSRTGLNIDQIDFETKVSSIVQNLKFMEGRERIDIRTKMTLGSEFFSDRSRLNVILGNLVSNAIRYSDVQREDSFIDISVTTTAEQAVIRVADNGIGIPVGKQAKVYEMFYRLSSQSTGSGLGLYIVKETVQKLNGEITLESKEGEGTVFTVVLPNLRNA